MNATRERTVLASILGALFVGKMVAFEPLRPDLFGMHVEVVAVLLPLALPLGWRGVAALGLGCGLAHSIHGAGIVEGIAAGTAVAGSLAIIHLGLRQPWNATGVLLRCLTLTGLLALTLGLAFAVALAEPLPVTIAATFANVVVPVALGGPAALLLAMNIRPLRKPVADRGIR